MIIDNAPILGVRAQKQIIIIKIIKITKKRLRISSYYHNLIITYYSYMVFVKIHTFLKSFFSKKKKGNHYSQKMNLGIGI